MFARKSKPLSCTAQDHRMSQTLVEAIECPECANPLTIQPALAGELVDCGGCGAELEVVSLQPLVVRPAPLVQEDWGE